MLEYVRKNIIKQIDSVIPALKNKDVLALRELSDHTIHSASVYQDQSSLVFALTVYSLSKIVERCESSPNFCVFLDRVVKDLEDSKDLLLINNINGYKKKRGSLLDSIGKIDKKFRFYIEEVIDKAKIKKGSKLHEHGVSLARAADLFGISQWELMNYVGKTSTMDSFLPAIKVKDRLNFARKLFNV